MNKFQFLGRLTKNVEERLTTSGSTVASFDIAVNRRFADESGNRATDFFKIVAFGKTSEFVAKYFKKGKQVLVEGRIQNRTWQDENGQKRYATDFIADQVYFADSSDKAPVEDTGTYITVDDTSDLPF